MSVEDSDYWSDAICTARCVILMSSTYGPGAPPSSANKFISWLQAGDGEAEEVFSGETQIVHVELSGRAGCAQTVQD